MMTYGLRKLVNQHSLEVEPVTSYIHEEGCYYYDGYWNEFYRVLAVKADQNNLLGVLVEYENGKKVGHCTMLNLKWDYKVITDIRHLFK